MARVKGGTKVQQRKKILKLAKGHFGSKHRLYRTANESVMKAWAYAYRDRRRTKRDFRKLWIMRINAATNQHGMSYSKFIHGLKIEEIEVNRKMLSEIAIHDPKAFEQLVKIADAAIKSGKKAPVKPAVVKKEKEQALPKIEVVEKDDKVEIKVGAPKTTKAAPKASKPTVSDEPKLEAKALVKPTPKESVDLESLTVADLKAKAKELGLTGYSALKKAELIELIKNA